MTDMLGSSCIIRRSLTSAHWENRRLTCLLHNLEARRLLIWWLDLWQHMPNASHSPQVFICAYNLYRQNHTPDLLACLLHNLSLHKMPTDLLLDDFLLKMPRTRSRIGRSDQICTKHPRRKSFLNCPYPTVDSIWNRRWKLRLSWCWPLHILLFAW